MSAPKMSRKEARMLWNSLSLEQKKQFNDLLDKLDGKEMMMTHIGVDDNEYIQRIILEEKNPQPKSVTSFAKHFVQE